MPLGAGALKATLRLVQPDVVLLHDPFWRPHELTRTARSLGAAVAKGGSVFSHDGRTLGTWNVSGGALMSVDPAVWQRDACAFAGRNLTPAEWSKYRPGTARQRTCPQYP